MHSGDDPFRSFLVSERSRHAKRARFAAMMAVLIAILAYQTQWMFLRPGLLILLAGQAGVVLALVLRNAQLSKELPLSDWFEREELFLKRLALFENACQIIGFITLGYELWIATRRLWLALAIGALYPATAYFGMARPRNQQAVRRLRTEKEKIAFNDYAGQDRHNP